MFLTMQPIIEALKQAARKHFDHEEHVVLTRPDEQFGDFATNMALQLAGKVGKSPRKVAEALVNDIQAQLGDDVKDVTIAGPGFINIMLSDHALVEHAKQAPGASSSAYQGKVV